MPDWGAMGTAAVPRLLPGPGADAEAAAALTLGPAGLGACTSRHTMSELGLMSLEIILSMQETTQSLDACIFEGLYHDSCAVNFGGHAYAQAGVFVMHYGVQGM